MYYLKELNEQELGFRKGIPHKAGRYIYITKSYGEFFPFLSQTVTNDNILLPIISPNRDCKIYTTLVYHNDKYTRKGGSRDEYRLYLNSEIDPDRNYFKPKDIIVFERIKNDEDVIPFYRLYRFDTESDHYENLSQILLNSKNKGRHAFVDELSFLPRSGIELDNLSIIFPKEVIDDVEVQQDEILSSNESIENIRGANLFTPVSFREFVLHAYNNKCAITGESIQYKKLSNLEAAHIQPKAHAGTYLPCNGLALCRDLHWAFDKGLFTIMDDYTIVVHNDIHSTFLKQFHGKKIYIPTDPYFQPEIRFLKHHRENIFGMFIYSGSIRSRLS